MCVCVCVCVCVCTYIYIYIYIYIFTSGEPLSALTCCVNVRLLSWMISMVSMDDLHEI